MYKARYLVLSRFICPAACGDDVADHEADEEDSRAVMLNI